MVRFVIDTLILRAFSNISIIQRYGDTAYKDSIEKIFNLPDIKNSIIKFRVQFDESLWSPEDETAYRNIVKIDFTIVGNNEITRLTLDLREDMKKYINCHTN